MKSDKLYQVHSIVGDVVPTDGEHFEVRTTEPTNNGVYVSGWRLERDMALNLNLGQRTPPRGVYRLKKEPTGWWLVSAR